MQRIKDAINPPSTREVMRKQNREIRQNQRQLDRGVRDMDRDEAKIKADIKKQAKSGNIAGARILAKQVVQTQHAKNRHHQASAHLSGVQNNMRVAATQQTLATSMAASTKAMAQMNKQMDPMKVQKQMMAFSQENAKFEMSEEMMNDAMDDCFDTDETAVDNEVNNVLTEILGDKMKDLGMTPSGALPATGSKTASDQMTFDIEAELRALQN